MWFPRHGRVLAGWPSAVLLLAGLALIVSACADPTDSSGATVKAKAFEDELHRLGIEAPEGNIAHLFGEDGAHVCAAARGDDLSNVVLVSHRFALRKTEVRAVDVEVNRVVVDIYCPEYRSLFNDFVAGLRIQETSDG